MVARLRWHLRSRLSLIHWQHNRTYVYNRVREARDREGWREGGSGCPCTSQNHATSHPTDQFQKPVPWAEILSVTEGGKTSPCLVPAPLVPSTET